MGFFVDFAEPFYLGTGTSAADVPSIYPVGLAGRGYQLDLKSKNFRHQTIQVLRQQADDADQPGEGSLNPEGLWRRGQESWHRGAGQVYFDRKDSDPFRFRSSKGIDVWDKWAMGLLPDTERKGGASVNTNLDLLTVGSRLYKVDGQVLSFTTDALPSSPTWTPVTGTPAATVQSVASNGFDVWVAYGASGVYATTRSSSAASSYNALVCTLLAFVKGRLMAANGPSIYNITSTTTPTALSTHANGDFAWVGFAEGPRYIYAAGFSGDKSEVYKIAIKADGTGLDVPSHAIAGLPDGEIVRAIDSYLEFIVLGTDKGVRFCTVDANGDLALGDLIPTTSAVGCFEGQDRFIWFGWTNYDALSTGLGRLDLREVVGFNAPAHASDLMATAQGAVTAVVTFQNRRLFAVSGAGFYGEITNLVASGTLDTGLITFGLADEKVGFFLAVAYTGAFAGTHRLFLSVDEGAFTALGSYNGTGAQVPFSMGQARARRFEIRHQLDRSATAPANGPSIGRHTLLADPVTDQGMFIFVPLLLAEHELVKDTPRDMDVAAELARLYEYRSARDLVIYQEGSQTYSVLVENVIWDPSHLTEDGSAFNGTATCQLKVIT